MKVEIIDTSFVNYESIHKMLKNVFSDEEIKNITNIINENTERKYTDLTLSENINYYILINGNTRVIWKLRLDNLGITNVSNLLSYIKACLSVFTPFPLNHKVHLCGAFFFL